MKISVETIGKVLLWLIIVGIILGSIWLIAEDGAIYETDSLSEYRKITGNHDNDRPAAFIAQFFPEVIQDSFSDVTYHYTAKKGDEYAYECYLEFVIEDEEAFNAFLMPYSERYKAVEFGPDSSFMEYSISNVLDMDWTMFSNEKGYPIQCAKIGKILYSPEEHRIIFVALGVQAGGGAGTVDLHYFFDRFHIDVLEYQMDAFFSEWDQEDNITYRERYELGMSTLYPYPEEN